MRVGAFNAGGVVQWTKPGFPELRWFRHLTAQGFGEPVLIATIRNVGRMPVTIESCNWHAKEVALSLSESPPGQTLPHRLEPHDKCIVAVRLQAVVAMIEASKEVLGSTGRDIWPEVQLGSGILRDAGIAHAGTHAMRHSAASIAIEQGIALPVVQEMLGHSDIRVTRGYVHVSSPQAEAAAATMGRALFTPTVPAAVPKVA